VLNYNIIIVLVRYITIENKRSCLYWILQVSFSAWVQMLQMRRKKPVISKMGRFFCFQ